MNEKESRELMTVLREIYKRWYRRRWPELPLCAVDDLPAVIQSVCHADQEMARIDDLDTLPPFHPKYKRKAFTIIPADESIIMPNALFCPMNNAIMAPSKYLLDGSFTPRLRWDPYASPRYMMRPPRMVSGYATPLRATWPAYFHTLVDALPRLLALHHDPFSDLDEIHLLTTSPPSDLENFFVERLAPRNCQIRVLEDAGRLHKVENMIFTSFKAAGGFLRSDYLRPFRERILPERRAKPHRRILISRKNSPKVRRAIANLRDLEAALDHWDFEIVYPETMDIEEEIDLFYDAEMIVGAHGSGLTNMLFSHRTSIIEMFATNQFVPVFYELALSLGHKYRYVMGDGEDLFPREYEVDVAAVTRHVRELLGAREGQRGARS